MRVGLWVWPADQRAQQRVVKKVAGSEHLLAALQALAKSKEGLSNAEIDGILADNSNWMTRWVVEQLVSLGFAEYKVDFFGGPGKYTLTQLGANALSAITGKPVQTQQPQAAPAKPPASQPAPSPPSPAPTPAAKPAATAPTAPGK